MTIETNNKTQSLRWKLAQSQPITAFLLLSFAWSWFFWFAAIPFREQNPLLVMTIVFIGGYGPAMGAILTLGLKNGLSSEFSGKKLILTAVASLLIFGLLIARYLIGNIPGYDRLPQDLTLTLPVMISAIFASQVGGWVISNALSNNTDIRERMKSILPRNLPHGWTLLAVFFFTGILLLSWGLASLLGLPVEYPPVWQYPLPKVILLFLLAFSLTALARGGMEEPGWRGLLQPAMQQKFSPLLASIIVSLFWSLWHLPLFLNGFYSEDILAGMFGGGIYRILLAIILTWFLNKTGGSLFLMIFLHTSFNMMVNYIPFSDTVLVVLLLIVVIVMVITGKMWRITRPEPSLIKE